MTPDEALNFAQAHQLVSRVATAQPLGGGVSNDTVLVSDGARSVVVKRALERLRVRADWHAPGSRAVDEAAALSLTATVTPDAVPRVLAVDDEQAVMAIAAAPAGWTDWKADLLAGRVDAAVAGELGRVLGKWQAATANSTEIMDSLNGMDRMESLRLEPFHTTISTAHADLSSTINQLADDLRQTRTCFVHGDFSPKNVLVGGGRAGPGARQSVWVIDFEVAHKGNPVFDLAFLTTHLLLKAIAVPSAAAAVRAAWHVFCATYRENVAPASPYIDADDVFDRLAPHTGCIVLARVDGMSPVEYLDEAAQEGVRRIGRRLIAGDVTLTETWNEVS